MNVIPFELLPGQQTSYIFSTFMLKKKICWNRLYAYTCRKIHWIEPHDFENKNLPGKWLYGREDVKSKIRLGIRAYNRFSERKE